MYVLDEAITVGGGDPDRDPQDDEEEEPKASKGSVRGTTGQQKGMGAGGWGTGEEVLMQPVVRPIAVPPQYGGVSKLGSTSQGQGTVDEVSIGGAAVPLPYGSGAVQFCRREDRGSDLGRLATSSGMGSTVGSLTEPSKKAPVSLSFASWEGEEEESSGDRYPPQVAAGNSYGAEGNGIRVGRVRQFRGRRKEEEEETV